jgi:ribosome biogenesis GTPase A
MGYALMRRASKASDEWTPLRRLIHDADVIVEVVDARDIGGTRLPLAERMSGTARLLILANKTDLLPGGPKIPEKTRIMWVNARNPAEKQRRKIIEAILSRTKKRPARALLVGYPNVGKSTLINQLANRKAAKVSPVAGTTKDIQWVRISEELVITDYRGVYPKGERSAELLRKGAINPNDKGEAYAYGFADKVLATPVLRRWLEKKYDLSLARAKDGEDVLRMMALRRGWLLKGGEPDISGAGRHLLRAMKEAPEM